MERKKIDKWDAIIYFDEVEKMHTITFDGEGGAIISDASLIEAERKFIEGMHLAESVGKLLHFKEHGTFPPKT
jgi:hypothetical protein